jgi:hypothetical protein
MAGSNTEIKAGDYSFDLAAVGNWVTDNLWLCVLLLAIAFVFHLFRVGGFAEKYLEYRTKRRELDIKQLDGLQKMADTLSRKYDGDEPFLPFDDDLTGTKK